MFSLNGTYIIFLALFLIFIYLLNEIMLKPVGKTIERRRAKLQENLNTAKACTQEAQNLLADYQAKLHASRLQSQAIIQTALTAAQKEREEKIKQVQANGRAKVDELKNELAANRQNLLRALIHPELELVSEIIKKLIGETPALVTSAEEVFQTMNNIR